MSPSKYVMWWLLFWQICNGGFMVSNIMHLSVQVIWRGPFIEQKVENLLLWKQLKLEYVKNCSENDQGMIGSLFLCAVKKCYDPKYKHLWGLEYPTLKCNWCCKQASIGEMYWKCSAVVGLKWSLRHLLWNFCSTRKGIMWEGRFNPKTLLILNVRVIQEQQRAWLVHERKFMEVKSSNKSTKEWPELSLASL